SLRERQGLGGRRLRQEHRELVAAQPGHGVDRPRVPREDATDVPGGAGPRLVSERVVDRLETVDVYAEDGRSVLVAAAPLRFFRDPFAETPTIQQPGQGV